MNPSWKLFGDGGALNFSPHESQGVPAGSSSAWEEDSLEGAQHLPQHVSFEGAGPSAFSPLDLRDRVVIMLLFDQIVREDQVARAWHTWQQMEQEGTKEPLWRVLTLFPELDRELVFAEAARVYGFEEARISRRRALDTIHRAEKRMRKDLWDKLVALRVVPIAEAEQPEGNRMRLIFAAQDPTRPDVHHLMPQLNLGGFELRYAPEREILNLLAEAFPYRYGAVVPATFEKSTFEVSDLERDTYRPPADPSTALRADRALIIERFEDVLVEAVQHGVSDVCMLPTPRGQMEIYFQVTDALKRWHVFDEIDPEVFLSVIMREVIRIDPDDLVQAHRCFIQRWIDDRLVRFRVAALPPSDAVPSACIVVRVLSA